MATFEMKLKPFPVPDSATIEMPPRPKQEGIKPLPTIPIEELSEEAIEELAIEWLHALYAARGKRCPFKRPIHTAAA